MDTSCRFIVGWSASLAENVLAVADALRYGVERYGIPAIYYSDNGGGEKNWMLDGDITGCCRVWALITKQGFQAIHKGVGLLSECTKRFYTKSRASLRPITAQEQTATLFDK